MTAKPASSQSAQCSLKMKLNCWFTSVTSRASHTGFSQYRFRTALSWHQTCYAAKIQIHKTVERTDGFSARVSVYRLAFSRGPRFHPSSNRVTFLRLAEQNRTERLVHWISTKRMFDSRASDCLCKRFQDRWKWVKSRRSFFGSLDNNNNNDNKREKRREIPR